MAVKEDIFINGSSPNVQDSFLNSTKEEINNAIQFFNPLDTGDREQLAQTIFTSMLGGVNMKTNESTSTGSLLHLEFNQFNKTVIPEGFDFFDGMSIVFKNSITNTGNVEIYILDRGPYSLLDSNKNELNAGNLGKEYRRIIWDSISGAFLLQDLDKFLVSGGYIGQFSYGARLDVPEGQLRCDGSPYTKSQFPTFFTSYLVGGKIPTVSYATYASEISANGVCGSFALDEVGETFKTPTITGSTFIAQALISGDIADFVSAGLPNITGGYVGFTSSASGAFSITGSLIAGNPNLTDSQQRQTNFNASASNSIYGNSTTVTPAHIKYPLFVCVSNTAVPASEAEYNAFIDGLTNKASIDADNLSITGKNNILAFALPQAVNTASVVGQVVRLSSANSGTLTLPAGGTWLIFSVFSVDSSGGVVYNLIANEAVTDMVVAGGTLIRNAQSNHIQRAFVMRIL